MSPDQVKRLIEEGLAAWPASPLIEVDLVQAALADALMPLLAAASAAVVAPLPTATAEG